MRGKDSGGRFSIPYERRSIINGTTKELVRTVGQEINWWRWDSGTTTIDNIYDVGSVTGGRRWKDQRPVQCVTAVIYQGVTQQNERGFYNTDLLRATLNMDVVEEFFGNMPTSPDDFLRDRIVFFGEVFRPTRFYPRGLITDKYTLFTFDAVQVNPEEMINDRQFTQYADPGSVPL